jgi:hypothetical protein
MVKCVEGGAPTKRKYPSVVLKICGASLATPSIDPDSSLSADARASGVPLAGVWPKALLEKLMMRIVSDEITRIRSFNAILVSP